MSVEAWITAAVVVAMLVALAFELMPPAATVLTLAAVDRDHAKSTTPAPATTIATDPIAFRRAAPHGLVACLESDLESDPESDPASRGLSGAADDRPPSANGRRTTARSLERASHASGVSPNAAESSANAASSRPSNMSPSVSRYQRSWPS